ncbi:hypothetical protein [Oceanicola sp. 22II-s10i]|uniref:hypothetical protein n=1 Tax=Oceanicola sp. 22II-s10i TaxID=1317116 RepID=UPI000B527087|nr:hypothetical protein [Oceanicola sp. 22II-s10i]
MNDPARAGRMGPLSRILPAAMACLILPVEVGARYSPAPLPQTGWPDGARPEPPLRVFSDSVTNRVVRTLKSAEQSCAALPLQYRIDCLGIALQRAAQDLGNRPDYAEAKAILNEAAQRLRGLAQANEDTTAPAVRQGLTRVRAVRAAVLPQALRRADSIVREAETKLIRASGSSGNRKAHYTRIAAAVGSTKVLLRSA